MQDAAWLLVTVNNVMSHGYLGSGEHQMRPLGTVNSLSCSWQNQAGR